MKVKYRTDTVEVRVSAQEVDEFKVTWPCSELPDKSIQFLFDYDGNLLDVSTDVQCGSVNALAEDAWKHAMHR